MNNDLISREALIEDFKSRLADCNDWLENAKDKETKIRASAVKTFIAEVIMTINNVPTVEGEILTEEAYSDLCLRASRERPQGEWIDKGDFYRCSNCNAWDYFDYQEETCPNYCPNCGAKMKRGASWVTKASG